MEMRFLNRTRVRSKPIAKSCWFDGLVVSLNQRRAKEMGSVKTYSGPRSHKQFFTKKFYLS